MRKAHIALAGLLAILFVSISLLTRPERPLALIAKRLEK